MIILCITAQTSKNYDLSHKEMIREVAEFFLEIKKKAIVNTCVLNELKTSGSTCGQVLESHTRSK